MSTSEQYTVNWYRTPLDKEVLQKLNERSDLKGLWQGAGHAFLWLLTASAVLLPVLIMAYGYSWWWRFSATVR